MIPETIGAIDSSTQQWLNIRGFDRNTFNERVLTTIHSSLDKNS